MTKLTLAGIRVLLLAALAGLVTPAEPARSQSGEVRTYNVSAIDVVITLNRFGDHDPEGKMFALDENIQAVRQQEAKPLPDRVSIGLREDAIQPLVIRANIGDTVVIKFTNRLRNGRASMDITGLPVDPKTSAGSHVGLNPDTTVGPGESITYTWNVPDERSMEGSYVFSSMGDDMRQQMAHGLFGVLNVEPKGSVYLDPVNGQPVRSGWEAVIADPSGKDFREDTIIYHEVGDELFDVRDREGNILPTQDHLNEDTYRPASRALNYRSEPFMRRQELLEPILGHPDLSQNYGSYTFGDVPTPTPRGYLGDPTKRRIVHAGSERFHVEHLHGGSIRWQFEPFAAEPPEVAGGPDFFGLSPTKDPPAQTRSQRLDSQSIGPLEAYTAQVEAGAGGLQNVPGDFLFHCHFAHHYVGGMWAFWRVFDTLQTGALALWQVDSFPLIPLRDRQSPPVALDSTRLFGSIMPSGRTVTDGPTSNTNVNMDEWVRTNVPPQGDPGPETAYDASVWNWVRIDDAGQLDRLAQQDPTIPTLALLRSLGLDPLPGRPLYLGEPETTRSWTNYQAPPGTAGKRLPVMFNASNARPTYPMLRPHLGRRPPFSPMRGGSPWSGDLLGSFPEEHPNPMIPSGARRLEYVKVSIPLEAVFNREEGIENDEAALLVLDEEKEDIRAGRKPAEQLTVRANVGDGIDIVHYSELPPDTFDFFKSNIHYHFVQFETQASDGVISGMSYEQSVRPYQVENIHLAADAPAGNSTIQVDNPARLKVNAFIGIGFGAPRRNRDGGNLQGTLNRDGGFEWAQIIAINGNSLTLDRPLANNHSRGQFVGVEFVRQQLFADAESGSTYFHNHIFAVPGFGLALTGNLLQEPTGSTWHSPVTGAPIRSGTLADIKNVTMPVAPGVPIQDFREFALHQMDAITGVGKRIGGERGGFNMKMEPLDQGDRKSDPHLAFSSVRNGDPETPVLRAYTGDLAVIRLLASSGHDLGSFHLEGHRFRQTRFDANEAAKDTVEVGISERYDLFFTAGSVGLQAGDYVFMNSMGEKMLDAWGILRVMDTLQPDLQPLGGPVQSIRPPDNTTFPQNRPRSGDPPPAPRVNNLGELKTKLERNGYRLMNDLPLEQIPVRTYDVVAMDTQIRLSEGFQKANGRIYTLAADEQDLRTGIKPPAPLVLRANIGEVVRLNFTNKLRNDRASFSVPQLIKSCDDMGSAFGLNNDSTVAPGETRTYWYVLDPRHEVPRSFMISDHGDPIKSGEEGLYGLFIVEPAGATYHDPRTGQSLASGAGWDVQVRSPEGAHRDIGLILHDEDATMNRDQMPYQRPIARDRAINYRAAPLEKRDPDLKAHVLSTLAHGDPGTSLIEVTAGEPVHLHVGAGFGQQPHVLTIDGHRFPFEDRSPGLSLSARLLASQSTIDAVLEGGAGGVKGFPGDYLIRDGRNPFFEGGLWAIMRVAPRPAVPQLQVNLMGSSSAVAVNVATGATEQALTASSPDGVCTVSFPKAFRVTGPDGAPAGAVNILWDLNPPPAPDATEVVLAMDLQPSGLEVTPEMDLTINYAPLRLPLGVSENDLFIAEWDGVDWKETPSAIDTTAKVMTARMDGLRMYALMGRLSPSGADAGSTESASVPWQFIWGLVGGMAAIAVFRLAIHRTRRIKTPIAKA